MNSPAEFKSYRASLFFEEVCTAWFALADSNKAGEKRVQINIHRSVSGKILRPHESGNRCCLLLHVSVVVFFSVYVFFCHTERTGFESHDVLWLG